MNFIKNFYKNIITMNTLFKNIVLGLHVFVIFCLNEQITAQQMMQPEHANVVSIIPYQPILAYQNTLYEMLQKLLTKYIYQEKVIEQTIPNEVPIVIPSMTRDEALQMIKEITNKIFDMNDPVHISVYLENAKKILQYLDPVIDAKTIAAIEFLHENQHKSSVFYVPFWIQKIKEKELKTAIPMNAELSSKSDIEKLKILQKKLAAPNPEA